MDETQTRLSGRKHPVDSLYMKFQNRQNYLWWKRRLPLGGPGLTGKGYVETTSDGIVLYLDGGFGYTSVYICQKKISKYMHKACLLHYKLIL